MGCVPRQPPSRPSAPVSAPSPRRCHSSHPSQYMFCLSSGSPSSNFLHPCGMIAGAAHDKMHLLRSVARRVYKQNMIAEVFGAIPYEPKDMKLARLFSTIAFAFATVAVIASCATQTGESDITITD